MIQKCYATPKANYFDPFLIKESIFTIFYFFLTLSLMTQRKSVIRN